MKLPHQLQRAMAAEAEAAREARAKVRTSDTTHTVLKVPYSRQCDSQILVD